MDGQDEIPRTPGTVRALLEQANEQLRDQQLVAAAISIRIAGELQANPILQTLGDWAIQLAVMSERETQGAVQ